MMPAITYSVIIPVYNGAATLRDLCMQLDEAMDDHEIILVDDGSTDESWECIGQLSMEYDTVKGIRLQQNYGQHPATICGLEHASGQFCITMDDDMQHSPKDISQLIRVQAEKGVDVVYGYFDPKHGGAFRRLVSSLFRWNARSLGYRHEATSFRLITRNVAEQLLSVNEAFVFIDALLPEFTSRIAFVKVQHNERVAGYSGYTMSKLLKLYMGIVGHYILPVKRRPVDHTSLYKVRAFTK